MKSDHPLLIYDRSVNVHGNLIGDLYGDLHLPLYYPLYWLFNIDGLIYIDGFINIDRPVNLNVDRPIDNLPATLHLPLNIYNFLYYPFGALNIPGYLDSDLDRPFYNNLLDSLSGHLAVLIPQLSLEQLDLFLQPIVIPRKPVNEPVMFGALLCSFLQVLQLYLKSVLLLLGN